MRPVPLRDAGTARGRSIEQPAPTAWPLVTAFGIALAALGVVTHWGLIVLGLGLLAAGAVGGVLQVLPAERTEAVAVAPAPPAPPPARSPRPGEARHRMRIPVAAPPYSAGARGGLAGGAAMAAVAVAYGLVAYGSPWPPINLLAAVAMPSLATAGVAELRSFHALAFAIATLVHVAISIGVGLLYAVLVPMLPGRAWPWGALLAPLLWSGTLAATLDLIDPALAARIDWGWFVASQVAFGLVTGVVVARSRPVAVLQRLPLAARAGLERGGTDGEEPDS